MSVANFLQVRSGLRFVFWGVVGYLVLAVVGIIIGGDPTVDLIVRICQIVTLGLVFAGQALCVNVPPGMPGAKLLYGALLCESLTILTTISLFFWNPIEVFGNLRAMIAVVMLSVVLFLLGDILFNVFLQKLATFIEDPQSASRASGVLILKIIVWSLAVLSVVAGLVGIVMKAPVLAGFGSFALMAISGILSVLVLAQYLTLLSGLQYSLMRAARPSFEPRKQAVDDEQELGEMFQDFEG